MLLIVLCMCWIKRQIPSNVKPFQLHGNKHSFQPWWQKNLQLFRENKYSSLNKVRKSMPEYVLTFINFVKPRQIYISVVCYAWVSSTTVFGITSGFKKITIGSHWKIEIAFHFNLQDRVHSILVHGWCPSIYTWNNQAVKLSNTYWLQHILVKCRVELINKYCKWWVKLLIL